MRRELTLRLLGIGSDASPRCSVKTAASSVLCLVCFVCQTPPCLEARMCLRLGHACSYDLMCDHLPCVIDPSEPISSLC